MKAKPQTQKTSLTGSPFLYNAEREVLLSELRFHWMKHWIMCQSDFSSCAILGAPLTLPREERQPCCPTGGKVSLSHHPVLLWDAVTAVPSSSSASQAEAPATIPSGRSLP